MTYQIERQRQSVIIQGQDGKLYQVTPVDEAIAEPVKPRLIRDDRSIREQVLRKRNEQANRIGYLCLGIGGVFIAAIVLLMFGAIFASATKPAAPEITNPYCQHFCF